MAQQPVQEAFIGCDPSRYAGDPAQRPCADLPDLLRKRAILTPDRVALEEIGSGRTLTYAALDARAGKVAGLLSAHGVGEGDRVAILCRNRIGFFELLFGCARIGAILVPLNWRMPPAELFHLLADCTPRLLFHDDDAAPAASALAGAAATINLDAEFEALVAAAPDGPIRESWPADAIWYLIYTSGTTGRPRGVIYTRGMAVANFVNIGTAIDIAAADVTAAFLPNFHTAGINLHALPTLMQGGRVLILPGFDAEKIVALLEAERLDTMFAVPTVYQALLDHPRFAVAPLSRVRHWGCGGAPLPVRTALRCRDLGIRLCNGMGMTETGPTALLSSPADAWDRIGSVGKPQMLVRARIVDGAGNDVADGQVGELLFAGPAVTPGYWNDADETRAAFTDDGWLRSGDLARRDAEGFYYIAGRRKEMFISGGENVFPAEVEAVLALHPAVAEAAVTPVPDAQWGEVGCAFLCVANDAVRPSESELLAFCRARLAAYKVPKSFEFVAAFPRTAAGKVQKHLLQPGLS
ncbi:long-chain fatty acid--CoA ligase [Sphingosinicella sp. BN140058]|uniref:acyl-CoA synthetase n=1 Tax=Sphingosinicella sp. BN140058 TaxID=1892855 RepID=UPI0010133DF4|nr:long-chain fatty acid--CoA ligase [Sphingosinicella sp. BN140058]QAY77228.1 acid--CoA ligase [Sphingosinicella sp. BN140058]